MDTKAKINEYLTDMIHLLEKKNDNYGNSALVPIRIFNKENSKLIETRIDDKLSRIFNSNEIRPNDCYDIIGYIILMAIRDNWELPTKYVN